MMTALCVLTLGGLSAQDEDSLQQKNTALLKVYPEREQVVTKASALAEAGRFAEALAIYDEALSKHPGTVVPLDKSRAVGIRDYVRAQIESWPDAGRVIYRRRADALAEHLFTSAKKAQDAEALERLLDEYPFSSYVPDALSLIANLALDAGESERAAAALARLLALEAEVDRPVALARLGLAYARSGQKALLEDLERRADRESPGAELRVAGRKTSLQKYLRGLAAATREGRPASPALELPAWEMAGGAPSGSRLAEPGVDLPRLAWAETVGLPRLDADDEMGFRRGPSLTVSAEFRPLLPAVSDGVLYVQNGVSVGAYHLFARRAERLWHFRVPPPPGEVMFDNRVIHAVSVHDGRVFANLVTAGGSAEDQLGYVRVKFPFPKRALYAFDAATGKPLWRLGGKPFQARGEPPGARARLEDIGTFSTPPTPEGGRLYVGAILQRFSTDPFEHYVLCLEPSTGRILWSSFVASGGTEINLFGNSTRESLGSPVAVADDTVYYVTNHGIVAGLDKATGRLRWTYRYRQLAVMPTRSVYVTKNRLGWVSSPPVVARGVVAVTPTDSDLLYGLDARTGELKWEHPRVREVRCLYGVRDTTLVLGGERLELLDVRTGERVAPLVSELDGTGRGVVAQDAIYVPCRDKLRRVGWDGAWDEEKSRPWPGGPGDGGNLLVVDGAMVLATQDGLQVYCDRKDTERVVAAALVGVSDPAALYRGAIRLLQAGASGDASDLLAKVVERTSKSVRPDEERLHRAARKRLFAVLLEAGRGELAAGRTDRAAERFRAAREAAPDTAAHVEAALLLGQAYGARGEEARAVAELQQLLAAHGDAVLNGVPVFETARSGIEAVLRRAGRAAYAVPEEAARKLMAAARREGTPDAFEHVYRLYPNSAAAEEALFEAAAAQARLGRPDREVEGLRRFLREYAASPRAPEAHATLVRALEKKGHHASAAALLRRMSRVFPDADVSDGDRKVTARDFAERRLKGEAYARAAVAAEPARLTPPLAKAFEHTERSDYREGIPLRVLGAPPPSAADLLLMNYGLGVKAFDLGRRAEAWHVKTTGAVRLAAFTEESLLLADEETVARVNVRTGAREWAFKNPARMRGFALAGSFVVFLSADPRDDSVSRVTAVDAAQGTLGWSQTFEGMPASGVHAAGDHVVFTTVSPHRIHLFETETGKRVLSDAPFTPSNTAQVVHAGPDLLILHAERRFLEAYDLPAGTLRWRVNVERLSTRAVEVGAAHLVLLGVQRSSEGEEQDFLAVVSLRNGKLVAMKEKAGLADPRFLLLEGEKAYVVSREADRTVSVRAVRLSDLGVEWTANAGGAEATLLPPALARDHVVVATFEEGNDRKYAYGASLLDKRGVVGQNIRSEAIFERPPNYGIANGALIFSVDTKVDVHR